MLEEPAAPANAAGRPAIVRPLIVLAVLVGAVLLAQSLDLGRYLGDLREWIDSLGWLGPFAFVAIYAIAVVAAVPGSAMTVVAGAIFGTGMGVLVVSIAATLGAALSFLLARYIAREPIARWLSDKDAFRRLDSMTERHGAAIVALTRLLPVFPFNLLNYGFGLTRVPFWTYVFWSWLCMLPGTLLYVAGADAVSETLSSGEIPWALFLGVAAAAVLVFLLVRFARSKLRDEDTEAPRP